jgi:Fe-S cluster assembly scaffold protein SufB
MITYSGDFLQYSEKWAIFLKTNVSNRYFVHVSPGVDVMITIFCDFSQFSEKKLAFFKNTNIMIIFLHDFALL